MVYFSGRVADKLHINPDWSSEDTGRQVLSLVPQLGNLQFKLAIKYSSSSELVMLEDWRGSEVLHKLAGYKGKLYLIPNTVRRKRI